MGICEIFNEEILHTQEPRMKTRMKTRNWTRACSINCNLRHERKKKKERVEKQPILKMFPSHVELRENNA